MRAHNAVDIIVLPKLTQKTRCKSALSIVFMDHQLSDPAHLSPLVYPATRKYITSKDAVDGDSDVRTRGVIGEVFGSESLFTESHVTAFISSQQAKINSL